METAFNDHEKQANDKPIVVLKYENIELKIWPDGKVKLFADGEEIYLGNHPYPPPPKP